MYKWLKLTKNVNNMINFRFFFYFFQYFSTLTYFTSMKGFSGQRNSKMNPKIAYTGKKYQNFWGSSQKLRKLKEYDYFTRRKLRAVNIKHQSLSCPS